MPGGLDVHTHMEMPFGGTHASDTFETVDGTSDTWNVTRSPRRTSSTTVWQDRKPTPRPALAARLTPSIEPSSQIWLHSAPPPGSRFSANLRVLDPSS